MSTTRVVDTAASIGEGAALLGFDELTPVQRECVDHVVGGGDLLAVIATGGGKSAIYQVAGQMTPGLTVVVTPLLALADDQRRAIDASDLQRSASIDGSTTVPEREEVLQAIRVGVVGYLFVTPEMFANDDLLSELGQIHVSLLAVDEAHCVATWGQSFRSDYLLLGESRRRLGSPACLALTASADPRLRNDVIRILELADPKVAVESLVRTNIRLHVRPFADRRAASDALVDYVAGDESKTLVYVPTRKLCTDIARRLESRGRLASIYHGQLKKAEKAAAAQYLIDDPTAVVVATNAFGMGVDVSDVRTVVHLDLPPTLIEYYQEIGRAGRDGAESDAVAFVGLEKGSRRAFSGGVHTVEPVDCEAVLAAIRAGTTSRRSLAKKLDMSAGRVSRALTVLGMVGAVVTTRSLRATDAEVDTAAIERTCLAREEFHRSQLQALSTYRGSAGCRWQQLLGALGEPCDPCGNCDNCGKQGDVDLRHRDPSTAELTGTRLHHRAFGKGTIIGTDNGDAFVSFDDAGPKQIDLDMCFGADLITIDDESAAKAG